ncbi:MAG TPA: putative photosynthetic complex assembly protein PuhE [Pseudomonadales bacterium]|nr:putative photosynthetic complex assembly protein PuhE [Pseudomonadales bacterium]
MSAPGWPLLLTLLFWWGSTGVILYLASRPALRPLAMWGASALAAAALVGLLASSGVADAASAYCAFTCGLLIWGWVEMSYLAGVVTGPRWAQVPCPPGATTGRRFLLGIATSLYHELAVIGIGVALVVLTLDAPNRVGAWTFVILWVMRWSAKLNLFLGVPNLNAEFFPAHLRYLETYIARRPMNLLFPLSVTIGTALAALLIAGAFTTASEFESVAGLTLGTLLGLAVLEHWFMVIPLRDAELWRWALPRSSARRRRTAVEPVLPAVAVAELTPGRSPAR